MKRDILYNYEVSHPEYGTVVVPAIGPDTATLAAAEKWGAVWRFIAGECTVHKGGPCARPRCRRCGGEFGEPGGVGVYCPSCEAADARYRAELRRVRSTRRVRPGMED